MVIEEEVARIEEDKQAALADAQKAAEAMPQQPSAPAGPPPKTEQQKTAQAAKVAK